MTIYKNVAQTKTKSLIESILDIIIGFVIYLPVNYFVLPLFTEGINNHEILTMLQISAIYTSIALVRKYTVRRLFVELR